jgi:formylglycine-generating enzyme required for sulfatase activity
MPRLLAILAACLLSGCQGSPEGDVSAAVGLATSPYLVLDLSDRTWSSRMEISDLTANLQWRTTHMVFRRLPVVSGTIGASSADIGTELGDAATTTVGSGAVFIAVFETTQAQWLALGGTADWLEDGIRAAGGDVISDGAPAFGISRVQALTVTQAFSRGRGYTLGLPTSAQWELACRAGDNTSRFAWGDSFDTTLVRGYAAVFETQAGITGPRPADGSRVSNAFGYFDCHGNVWEWLAENDPYGDGLVCGGSWNDTLPLARCSNRVPLDPIVAHPLVGVRLVVLP